MVVSTWTRSRELSQKVSRRLDLEGFEPGPYALEVSTPGIERPLAAPAGLPARGRRACARQDRGRGARRGAPRRGGRRDPGREPPRASSVSSLDEVAAAKTVVDWDEELKRRATDERGDDRRVAGARAREGHRLRDDPRRAAGGDGLRLQGALEAGASRGRRRVRRVPRRDRSGDGRSPHVAAGARGGGRPARRRGATSRGSR